MLSDLEQLTQIDAEVKAHQTSILQLFHKRNKFIPIARLPPEVLSRVFLCLKEAYIHSKTQFSYSYTSKTPAWFTVTHVCRHWRDVSFEFPELWGHIDLQSSAPWVEAYLERSKQAPLIVTIPSALNDRKAQTAFAILSQPQRLQSLKITGHDTYSIAVWANDHTKEIMGFINSLSGVHVPILKDIYINMGPSVAVASSGGVILPVEFCNGGSPALRHLELRGCALSWTSPLFSNLTSLKLHSGRLMDSSGVTDGLASFLDALERMPALGELEIWAITPVPAVEHIRHNTVALRNLKKLRMTLRLQTFSTLLKYIYLPITTTVYFSVPNDPSPAESASLEFASDIHDSWLSAPLGLPATSKTDTVKPTIRTMQINPVSGSAEIAALSWFQPIDFAGAQTRSKKNHHLRLVPTPASTRSPLKISIHPSSVSLITSLPIQNLVSLDLRVSTSQCTWKSLSRLPHLQSIALNAESAPGFVSYIYTDPAMKLMPVQAPEPEIVPKIQNAQKRVRRRPKAYITHHLGRHRSQKSGRDPMNKKVEKTEVDPLPLVDPTYFPSLVTISITGTDFWLERYSYPEPGMAIHWEKFLNFLLFRRSSSMPIKFFRALICINLLKENIKSIKMVVPKVLWDGSEEERDDADLEEDWSEDHDWDDCEGQCEHHMYDDFMY